MYRRLVKEFGIKNIKPYKRLRWKHGVCYFTGKKDGKSVFIKTSGILNTILREKKAILVARNDSYLKNHVAFLYNSEDSNSEIVEDLIKGLSLTDYCKIETYSQDEIVKQLYKIYYSLRKCKIAHLDIRPDNFIVSYKNDRLVLYLIDFGYALVDSHNVFEGLEKNEKSVSILRKLGSYYSPRNGTFDDAYSMLLTMKYVCPSLLSKHTKIWQEMNNEIGKNTIRIKKD